QPASGEPGTGERKPTKILVCEDHGATCRILRRMLAGHAVTVVENEADLYKNLTDVTTLLLDINLHGKERGAEIMKSLRADPQNRDLRIIAFTAHCLPG